MLPNPLHRQRYRRKLLRRTALYVFLPIFTLLIVRHIWGFESSHRLAATMAKLRAQGLRLSPEEFGADSDTSKDSNAYYDYAEGIKGFNPTNAERELIYPTDASELQSPSLHEARKTSMRLTNYGANIVPSAISWTN